MCDNSSGCCGLCKANKKSAIARHWRNHTKIRYALDGTPTAVFCYKVLCADGFSMSVQASEANKCEPRRYLANGAYKSWEVAFPSKPEADLEPFRHATHHYDIFAFVPTDVINSIISKHGGLDYRHE